MAATALHRFVILHIHVEEKLAKKEHASGMGNYELPVAPYPTQPRLHRPVAFEHGCRVAEAAETWSFFFAVGLLADAVSRFCVVVRAFWLGSTAVCVQQAFSKCRQTAQFVLHDVVIVLAVGVGCQLQLAIGDTPGWDIAESNAHNALDTRHKKLGIHTLVSVVGHIRHVCIAALGEPFAESCGDVRVNRRGLGYATSKKAEVFSLGLYTFTQMY